MKSLFGRLALVAAMFLFAGIAQGAGYIGIRPVPLPQDWPEDWYYYHYYHHHHHYVPPPRWPRLVQELQPMVVKEHLVKVSVKSQVATTTVEQCFYNPNDRQLEGQFIFPFEDDAAVGGFSLWMNGKEVKGELLDAQKARGIYEDIVRRMRDPGLLEYVGRRTFRCRIFPIAPHGECRIKLSYTRALSADADLVEFAYPLRGGQPAEAGAKLALSVDLEDSREILSLYSPTHKLEVVRKDPKHLVASFEGQAGDKDFKLFYNVSRKDVGLSFIAYRPENEPGTFLAIFTPRDTADEKEIAAKDLVFVLDTSGSMQEDGKIEQARKALKFCLASLREKDHFALITFATEAQVFAGGLQPAEKAAVARALEHVDKNVTASGGTAIDEALGAALKLNPGKDRPFMVVFLTDGEPTIGERDPKRIIDNAKGRNAANVRLFAFGVGADVNTALLDDLAAACRGTSSYVLPKEDLEVKVSSFYARVSSPVLTDLQLDFGALEAYDVCPRKFGDLFRDQQLVVVGRYRGNGGAALTLTGKLGTKEKKLVYEVKAPEKDAANDFLPRVWAMRRVGELLEDVRQHGENAELRAEIVRLSKLHGIMTPYTSWLVVEDERQLAPGRTPPPAVQVLREDFDRRREAARAANQPAPAAPGGYYAGAMGGPGTAPATEAKMAMKDHAEALRGSSGEGTLSFGARDSFEADNARRQAVLGGKIDKSEKAAGQAVLGGGGYSSDANKKLAEREGLEADGTYAPKDASGRRLIREVGGRAFYFADGKWIDGAYQAPAETVKVKCLSDEYFKLLKAKPGLAPFFALGDKVIVQFGGKFYEVIE